MKTVLMVAVLAALAPAAVAAQTAPATTVSALDPARLEAGRALIAVVMLPSQREKMIDGVMTSMMGNMMAGIVKGNGLDVELEKSPSAKRVFADFIAHQREVALKDVRDAMPDLIEAYAHAYARIFTVEEMAQIRTFMATSAGIKFAGRSTDLFRDPDVAAWQQNMAARGGARMRGELEQFSADMKAAFAKDGVTHHAG